MTRRRDFKRRVRNLTEQHGVTYTAALQELAVESAVDAGHAIRTRRASGRPTAGVIDRGHVVRKVKVESVRFAFTDEERERFQRGDFAVDNLALVVLQEAQGERVLHIFMQQPEAWAIQRGIEGVDTPRPMTHDLYVETIRSFDSTLIAARVTHVDSKTIFAELVLSSPTGERVLSARPSDAIAIALRLEAPILVADDLLHVLHPPPSG